MPDIENNAQVIKDANPQELVGARRQHRRNFKLLPLCVPSRPTSTTPDLPAFVSAYEANVLRARKMAMLASYLSMLSKFLGLLSTGLAWGLLLNSTRQALTGIVFWLVLILSGVEATAAVQALSSVGSQRASRAFLTVKTPDGKHQVKVTSLLYAFLLMPLGHVRLLGLAASIWGHVLVKRQGPKHFNKSPELFPCVYLFFVLVMVNNCVATLAWWVFVGGLEILFWILLQPLRCCIPIDYIKKWARNPRATIQHRLDGSLFNWYLQVYHAGVEHYNLTAGWNLDFFTTSFGVLEEYYKLNFTPYEIFRININLYIFLWAYRPGRYFVQQMLINGSLHQRRAAACMIGFWAHPDLTLTTNNGPPCMVDKGQLSREAGLLTELVACIGKGQLGWDALRSLQGLAEVMEQKEMLNWLPAMCDKVEKPETTGLDTEAWLGLLATLADRHRWIREIAPDQKRLSMKETMDKALHSLSDQIPSPDWQDGVPPFRHILLAGYILGAWNFDLLAEKAENVRLTSLVPPEFSGKNYKVLKLLVQLLQASNGVHGPQYVLTEEKNRLMSLLQQLLGGGPPFRDLTKEYQADLADSVKLRHFQKHKRSVYRKEWAIRHFCEVIWQPRAPWQGKQEGLQYEHELASIRLCCPEDDGTDWLSTEFTLSYQMHQA